VEALAALHARADRVRAERELRVELVLVQDVDLLDRAARPVDRAVRAERAADVVVRAAVDHLEVAALVADEDDVGRRARLEARDVGAVPLDDERARVVLRVAAVLAREGLLDEAALTGLARSRGARDRLVAGTAGGEEREGEAREHDHAGGVRSHGAAIDERGEKAIQGWPRAPPAPERRSADLDGDAHPARSAAVVVQDGPEPLPVLRVGS